MDKLEGGAFGCLWQRIDRSKQLALELLLSGGDTESFEERQRHLCSCFPPSRTPLAKTLSLNLRFPGVLSPSLIVHGPHGSGKSWFVEKLLTEASRYSPWVKVSCGDSTSARQVMEEVLVGMARGIGAVIRTLAGTTAQALAAEKRLPKVVADALSKPHALSEAHVFAALVAACIEPSGGLFFGQPGDEERQRRRPSLIDTVSAAKKTCYDQQRLQFLVVYLKWADTRVLPRADIRALLSAFSRDETVALAVRLHLQELAAQLSHTIERPTCHRGPLGFADEVRSLASLSFQMAVDAATFLVCGYLRVPTTIITAAVTTANLKGEGGLAFSPKPRPTKEELNTPQARSEAYLACYERPLRLRTLNFRLFLDDVERLVRLDGSGNNPIAVFYTLHKATRRSISVIGTTTAGAFVREMMALATEQPYSIPFFPYNAAETAMVLKAAVPLPATRGLRDKALFSSFLESVSRLFGPVLGNSMTDLVAFAAASYPAYSLPILRGELPRTASNSLLFDRFRAFYSSMRLRLYERDGLPQIVDDVDVASDADADADATRVKEAPSSHPNPSPASAPASGKGAGTAMAIDGGGDDQGEEDAAAGNKTQQLALPSASSSSASSSHPQPSRYSYIALVPAHTVDVRLPRLARFMLLASFLASNNPESTDKKFFSVKQTGKNKVLGQAALERLSRAKERRMLQGPQPASYERIAAIFTSLLAATGADEDLDPSQRTFILPDTDIQLQVSTMTALGYLERSSTGSGAGAGTGVGVSSGRARYTCALSWESALKVALSVSVELAHFIYDPET